MSKLPNIRKLVDPCNYCGYWNWFRNRGGCEQSKAHKSDCTVHIVHIATSAETVLPWLKVEDCQQMPDVMLYVASTRLFISVTASVWLRIQAETKYPVKQFDMTHKSLTINVVTSPENHQLIDDNLHNVTKMIHRWVSQRIIMYA
jgi:hypothetical protein